MDISTIVKALSSDKPSEISQAAYERSSSAFKRLCNLRGKKPKPEDLRNYLLAIQYEAVQLDLFKYLLPVLLESWKQSVIGVDKIGVVEEYLFPALRKKSLLQAVLSESEIQIVSTFIADAIMTMIDSQTSISADEGSQISQIFHQISSYAVLFPNLDTIWNKWWNLQTHGRCFVTIAYSSCLMYEDDQNPLFTKWSEERGGGPPLLNETGAAFNNGSWQPDNIHFLSRILTPTYVRDKLGQAISEISANPDEHKLAINLFKNFDLQLPVLEKKLRKLPILLGNLTLIEWPE